MDFENLISLTDAAKLIPNRPSLSTIWRWCVYGKKISTDEKVRLRCCVIGRKKYTTIEWLDCFFNKLTEEELKYFDGKRKFSRVRKKKHSKKSTTNRDASQRRAYDELRSHGINV